MRWTNLLLLLYLLQVPALGQLHEYAGYITPISELFDIENGNFHDIQEDWNGFMWMATNDGLYRFDGTTVKHFTHSRTDSLLPHNQVLDILVDPDNEEIWLGTALGLCRLDPANETSVIYQSKYEDPNSIGDNIVRYVYKDRQGQIWASSFTQGISLYRPETDDFQNFHFNVPGVDSIQEVDPTINESRLNSHRFIIQDDVNDNILWLASPLGLVSFNKEAATFSWPWARHPQLTALFPNNSVNVIHPMSGQLLVGTLDKAILYDVESGKIEFIQPETGSTELRYVTHISKRSPSELWISYINGLAAYDPVRKEVTGAWLDNVAFNQRHGIRYIDSEQRVWINSSGSTVMYDPQKQITRNYLLGEPYLHPSLVLKALNENEVVLLTSQAQFYHIFDLSTQSWRSEKIISDQVNWEKMQWKDLVKVDEQTWFLIEDRGIYRLDLATNKLLPFPLETGTTQPRLTKGLIDDQNNLWVASIRVGLFKININTGTATQYVDELNSEYSTSLYTWITDLYKDVNGQIWIRLARSFAVYQPDKDAFIIFPHREKADQTFRYVQNFAESQKGDIWMSSFDLGFGRTLASAPEKGVVEKFSLKEGLLSNQISDMRFDRDNLLWILTDKGVTTFNAETRAMHNYTWHRGIPKSNKLLPLANGKIALMLENGGIALLNPLLLQAEEIIPKPYVSAIYVQDKPKYNMGNRTGLENVTIHNRRDYLSFGFSALGYSNPKEFAYRLDGVDEDWVLTKATRSTSYSNLSPGNYKFFLKSRLEGGSWSSAREISVYLVPKWWETWWFRALALAIIFALAYRIYRWRLESVRQKERLKAEFQRKLDEVEMQALRSQMNPHFFFNSLNSIQLYIIKNEPRKAVEYLDRFSRLMRLILQNSRAKTVPLKDEIEALQLYMDLESLRFTVSFDRIIEIEPGINVNDIEIPPMLLQPFVENAIWHGIQHKGKKGEILISIKKKEDFLECTIQDDGIGREKAKSLRKRSLKHHKSMGMKITHDRLDMLNQSQNGQSGSIEIIDLYDEHDQASGTRVKIMLPII